MSFESPKQWCSAKCFTKGGSKQNLKDHALLRGVTRILKNNSKSFLTIALNTKFVPGKSIFLACRSVPNNFLGGFGAYLFAY